MISQKEIERFKPNDAMMLVITLADEEYSFDFIKQIIHELDTALENCDGTNESRKKILFKVIKEEHGPSNDELARAIFETLTEKFAE